ncbi:MAG TPA: PfkB family carbohydrate kinase [Chitinophagales bacterium]|jgi:sugar/nucleoside kinase (ribokinase family)|nr:bifunctional hydroxymethylpyrimidine kinase/phosphomethylpyrimidine kinase [Chitinophagales bacterium]HQV77062.1 PfkB family carbohydrate kinase [Chitinophagales bacterium]HQW77871.1 PfkB family carbohydrate kinase [Chitinophagales bacterium]HRB67435.1 PfkB family carbohydrate kinase [Chitinophagales bacterium]HRB69396.1 PfkB family carbohydrate kinase [Chitinophagales bacterium]
MSLLTVGTVAFDAIETPFGKIDKITGGSGNYICQSAGHFTNEMQLVSVIGDDFDSNELNYLKSIGTDIDGVQVKEGEKSFFWSGKYHMDLNRRDTLVTDLNVLANFDPILPEKYTDAEFLILGNIDPSLQAKVISQMTTRPRLIAMDTMNFWMEIALEPLKSVLKMVDLLIVNEEEARQLTNEYSLVKAAGKIKEMGPRFLIIKKGEHGALLFHGNRVFFAPALPLEDVFDPTGAGDTFAGGFMGYLAKTKDLSFENMKRAVIYGSAMASFCVEKFGPQRLKEISREEIEERVQVFIELVDFDIILQ